MTSIRTATVEDAEAIASVHAASWRAAYLGLLPEAYLDALDAGQRAAAWRAWLASDDGGSTFVVSADDGEAIHGFASVRIGDDRSEAELSAIYLDPRVWRRGLGTLLLLHVVAVLRQTSARAVLWVHPGNVSARRFYEKHGWKDEAVERVETLWGVDVPERRYTLALR